MSVRIILSRNDAVKMGAPAARVPSSPARRRLRSTIRGRTVWWANRWSDEWIGRAAQSSRPAACAPRLTASFRLRSILDNPGNAGRCGRKLAGAVWWQLRKRVSSQPRDLTLVNGARFWAYPDCVVSSALHYSDWPEYHELHFCRRFLRRGQLVFDVGANVGHLSLLLADVIGPENVVAFEPTPVTFRRLVQNFELNQWPITKLCHAAVGRTCGHIAIPDLAHPVTTNSPLAAATSLAQVPLVSLNSLVPEYRGREVGLLKVDVEGFEPEVFGGAEEFLREIAPRLVMFESLAGQPDPVVQKTLTGAGYRLFQLDDAGRPLQGDLSAQNLFAAGPDVCETLFAAEGTNKPSRPAAHGGPL